MAEARFQPASAWRPVVIIGEALIDVIRHRDGSVSASPGGSAANVALTLGRLGHRPTLITFLGGDESGQRVRAWLNASDVEVSTGTHGDDEEAPFSTSTSTARLDASGGATYEFDISWDPEVTVADGVQLVHTGSLATLLQPGADTVLAAVQQQRSTATITYDPNIRPALITDWPRTRQHVERWVRLADIVKVSDEDLQWLYPENDPLTVAANWQASGPAVVVLTSGARGATAISRAGMVVAEGQRVAVVDTVGAGDAFMGCLIGQVLHAGLAGARQRKRLHDVERDLLQSMLHRSCEVAAITVTREGANPPRVAELIGSTW
jgi:fructokinase